MRTISPDILRFIAQHGYRVDAYFLAAVTGVSEADIQTLRSHGVCTKSATRKSFEELFALWHGRQPESSDWPKPRARHGSYEWLAPELVALASLVGQKSYDRIATLLTKRLRKITGDPDAKRSKDAVVLAANRMGLVAGDVVGGITVTAAGREIDSIATVRHVIAKKHVKTFRVGRLLVIPHADWAAWKAKRVEPPAGYIQLSALKEPLAIKSDKLSEFARAGYIPTAVRANPYGTKQKSTQFGTWYVDAEVAKQLVSDRRAGRPMPWHGKANADNLKVTYKLWQERKHPAGCSTCGAIWGSKGAPKTFADYERRYPPLAHGAKRHLTRPWTPGLSIAELAEKSGYSIAHVKLAIKTGMLAAQTHERRRYVTKTEAIRWIWKKCPTGDRQSSWISFDTAQKLYGYSERNLRQLIANGQLRHKRGEAGPMRGVEYVLRSQCARLREVNGFTEAEAAKKAGVTIEQFRSLVGDVNWRKKPGIPLVTIQAVIKRRQSCNGYTIDEAAKILNKPPEWVIDRRDDGTIKVSRAKWDARRLYITEPMLQRLKAAKKNPRRIEYLSGAWLRLTEAAMDAGVSATTLTKWAEAGEVKREMATDGWRYYQTSLRTRAREYWKASNQTRAVPPSWLGSEAGERLAA